jgi:hypothetical protein
MGLAGLAQVGRLQSGFEVEAHRGAPCGEGGELLNWFRTTNPQAVSRREATQRSTTIVNHLTREMRCQAQSAENPLYLYFASPYSIRGSAASRSAANFNTGRGSLYVLL